MWNKYCHCPGTGGCEKYGFNEQKKSDQNNTFTEKPYFKFALSLLDVSYFRSARNHDWSKCSDVILPQSLAGWKYPHKYLGFDIVTKLHEIAASTCKLSDADCFVSGFNVHEKSVSR